MSIIFYQTFILDLENIAKDDLNKYQIVKDARDRILFCYGSTINLNKLNESCNIPLIEGYRIEILNTNNCSFFEKNKTENMRYKNRFTYAVPIYQNNTICLGKMQIYI
jgi:hypothetical protein